MATTQMRGVEVQNGNNSEVFEVEPDQTHAPDVWVEETFTNRYGDERAVLDGATYDVFVKAGVKHAVDWDKTHHKFNDRRKEWIVDVDGLEHFAEKAAEKGFVVDTSTGEDNEVDPALVEAAEYAEEGAEIEVEYHQKNGNGTNSKAGEIRTVRPEIAGSKILFERDDGQMMRVKEDEHGEVGLFTGGYHPFVGTVAEISIQK